MNAVIDERLSDIDLVFSDQPACCIVYGVPADIRVKYETGFPITGIGSAEKTGAVVFHAGTKREDGSL